MKKLLTALLSLLLLSIPMVSLARDNSIGLGFGIFQKDLASYTLEYEHMLDGNLSLKIGAICAGGFGESYIAYLGANYYLRDEKLYGLYFGGSIGPSYLHKGFGSIRNEWNIYADAILGYKFTFEEGFFINPSLGGIYDGEKLNPFAKLEVGYAW